MNVSTTIPPIVQIPRGPRLRVGVVGHCGAGGAGRSHGWCSPEQGETGDVARPSVPAQSWKPAHSGHGACTRTA